MADSGGLGWLKLYEGTWFSLHYSPDVTVTNVLGRGRQKGIAEVYRSHKEPGNLLRKVKLEIAVNEEFLQPTIEAIVGGARTGQIGDGKIFVFDLPRVIRIRTGEEGHDAIG